MLLKNPGLFPFQMALFTAHKRGWSELLKWGDRVTLQVTTDSDQVVELSSKGWRMKFQLKSSQHNKSTNQQTSLSPKDWHLFCFFWVHGSSSLPFFGPTKNVSPRKSKSNLCLLRSATLLDAWITLFGGLLRDVSPCIGPCWTFPLGSTVKIWIGQNNLSPLNFPKVWATHQYVSF